jgi:hypothetical protein
VPDTIHFATYTLKYNRLGWVQVDSLGEHWEQARVNASIDGKSAVQATTHNVTGLTLSFAPGWCPLEMNRAIQLTIDGQRLEAPRPLSDRSWVCQLQRDGDKWQLGASDPTKLSKRHNLQGPVDDAFMDSFVFVRPTGRSPRPKFEAWAASELQHAVDHWRQHFRGDARVKDDQQLTDDDIAAHNLILFGDPSSNSILARIADDLPIKWRDESLAIGQQQFAAADHAPILVYPNPLNPRRYVVLNSGFTFREYDYYNNARQTPKIPDWAIVDIREPVNNRTPGKVVAADFFDESWQVKE